MPSKYQRTRRAPSGLESQPTRGAVTASELGNVFRACRVNANAITVAVGNPLRRRVQPTNLAQLRQAHRVIVVAAAAVGGGECITPESGSAWSSCSLC